MITTAPPPPETERPVAAAAPHAHYGESQFPSLRLARSSRTARRLGRILVWGLVFVILSMLFAPWQQSIRGEGEVIALDPFERQQTVDAPVEGRIAERGEGVREGALVRKGQLLFRMQDLDPFKLLQLETQVLNAEMELRTAEGRRREAAGLKRNSERIVEFVGARLEDERDALRELMQAYNAFVAQEENKLEAARKKLAASEAKERQMKLDLDRKNELLEGGLTSGLEQQKLERDYLAAVADVGIAGQDVESARNGVKGKRSEQESYRQEWEAKIKKAQAEQEKARGEVAKAEIDIKKTAEEIQQKKNKLEELRSKVREQQTQEVRAPINGYVFDLAVFREGSVVKKGDPLCRIVPRMTDPAVQLWVAGNDVPLIHEGDHVRLQFEGWPAVQFSGWPSVAVGTFGGQVTLVDATDNGSGKFRVVVQPDETDDAWPEHPYLRQRVRTNGWVLLDRVALGYEVWRRMNGFPPALESKSAKDAVKPPKIKI